MALPLANTSYERNRVADHRGLILLIVVVGVLLRLYLLMRPGHLFGITEYDDGVYFGAAIHLVQGIVPYKDYVLVQPPGIAVMLSPIALLAKVIGTAKGLAFARVVTVAVDGVNIALVGLLIRSRGRIAVVAACGLVALQEQAIASSQTVLLEPYLNLFCLLALVSCFESFHFRPSRGAIFLGGVFFGVAGSIKTWAIIPAAVVLLVALVSKKRSALGNPLLLLVGTAAGFFAITLPFIVLAPHAFVSQVIVDQLARVPGNRIGLLTRMNDISGSTPFIWLVGHTQAVVLLLSVAFLVVLVIAILRTLADPSSLSVAVIMAAILVFLALLWPSDFYYHYADFEVPFLALTFAIAVSGVKLDLWGDFIDNGGRLGLALAGSMLVIVAILDFAYQAQAGPAPLPPRLAEKTIPVGSCVVSDQVSLLIASNRFFSTTPNCPKMLDPFGTALALSGGKTIDGGAELSQKVVANWLSVLQHASYVWLTPQNARRVPWTVATKSYFESNFRIVAPLRSGLGTIYERIGA
ncbi:MAG: phospholipid carrier-dependent glycosyltransferase [Actinomycetota bacterium]|nr:phospholipid carrier-dependent glycosyltransferase [Actinomycetota bacterium]